VAAGRFPPACPCACDGTGLRLRKASIGTAEISALRDRRHVVCVSVFTVLFAWKILPDSTRSNYKIRERWSPGSATVNDFAPAWRCGPSGHTTRIQRKSLHEGLERRKYLLV
jgi:hypothetical protein